MEPVISWLRRHCSTLRASPSSYTSHNPLSHTPFTAVVFQLQHCGGASLLGNQSVTETARRLYSPSGCPTSMDNVEPTDANPGPLPSDIVDLEASGSPVIESRTRRRKAKKQTPGSHELTFSVTCALALNTYAAAAAAPIGLQDGSSGGTESASMADSQSVAGGRGGKGGVEAPRALGYFHLEWQLFADSEQMKTDVVHYGVAAKVYPWRENTRTFKTWSSGDESWIAWTQHIKSDVTTDFLKGLADHKLNLRVWDSKDKCSTQCRWDTKPKAFRFPPPKSGQDPENVGGGVKASTLRISRNFAKQMVGRTDQDRPLPHEYAASNAVTAPILKSVTKEQDDAQKAKEPNYSVYALSKPDRSPNTRSYSRLERLATTDVEPEKRRTGSRAAAQRGRKAAVSDMKTSIQETLTPSTPQPSGDAGKPVVPQNELPPDASLRPPKTRQSKRKIDQEQERYNREGRCSVGLSMARLFIGQTVVARLKSPISTIEDMMISVTINGPLLSEIQKKDLNPLVVRIRGADAMPERPFTFPDLREKCEEAYCQYRFFDQPFHKTSGCTQNSKIVWDDVKVVLTGLYDKGVLREYLGGPAMEIEVHDRDRKLVEEKLAPALFGDDLEDEKISNIGTVTAKRTAHSAFGKKLKPWDPFGLTKVDLSMLLDGHKLVHFSLPILPCSIPDLIRGEVDPNGRVLGTAGAVDAPQDPPLPSGHYLETGSTLKVSLELLYPMTVQQSDLSHCPYGRLAFDISYSKMYFVRKVIRFVKQINAVAFGLTNLASHVVTNALLNYRLTPAQRTDTSLDFITGFHIMDGNRHLIVLEGLRNGAIKTLWKSLGAEAADQGQFGTGRVLYNESLAFSSRLYTDLDLDVMKVKLNESLSDLVQQPLLYVRDMVPRVCFDGLCKLFDLSQSRTMQNAVKNDLFPSAEMFRAVGREFGVPLTVVDLQRLENASPETTSPEALHERSRESMDRNEPKWAPLDTFNEKHLRTLAERKERPSTHNYMQENIKRVREESCKVQMRRASSCPTTRMKSDTPVAHNYSIQHLNSSELAKKKVRSACRPDKIYTYAPEFHNSGCLERDSLEDRLRREELESRRRWKSQKGWIFPGKKRSLDANQHPKRPDNARVDALKDKWEENSNHRAILQPSVPGRDSKPWKDRKGDFNTWQRPGRDATFGNEPPTIMAAGVHQENELTEAAMQELDGWLDRLVVSDTRFHSHRLLPATENTEQGLKAANDIDKLRGLLKDKPVKYGLLFPGYRDVPTCNVIRDTKYDRGAYMPADSIHVSLNRGFLPKERDSALVNSSCSKEPLYHRRIDPLTVEERENNLFLANGTILHPIDAARFESA